MDKKPSSFGQQGIVQLSLLTMFQPSIKEEIFLFSQIPFAEPT